MKPAAFDYVRAEIQGALYEKAHAEYVDGWAFQEATCRTEALFKRLFGGDT